MPSQPVAQMLSAEITLAWPSTLAGYDVMWVHVLPCRCQVPIAGPAPVEPKAQTSVALSTLQPVTNRPLPKSCRIVQWPDRNCSAAAVVAPTGPNTSLSKAQTFPGELAPPHTIAPLAAAGSEA